MPKVKVNTAPPYDHRCDYCTFEFYEGEVLKGDRCPYCRLPVYRDGSLTVTGERFRTIERGKPGRLIDPDRVFVPQDAD